MEMLVSGEDYAAAEGQQILRFAQDDNFKLKIVGNRGQILRWHILSDPWPYIL